MMKKNIALFIHPKMLKQLFRDIDDAFESIYHMSISTI